MRRLLLLMVALFGLALSGCGAQWFPDATSGGAVVTPFTFTSLTGVAAGATQTSNAVTVTLSGGTTADISVTNGSYIINNGAPMSTAGTVRSGDQVKVQHTSAASSGQTVTTTLKIGNQTATFSSTTATVSAAAFSFSPAAFHNVSTAKVKTSNLITVTLTGGTSAPISITNGKYQINRAGFTPTDQPGTISNGEQLIVYNTAAAAGASQPWVVTTLTIADKSTTFTTTTGNVAPQTFSFTADAGKPFYGRGTLYLKSGTYDVKVDSSTSGSGGYLFSSTVLSETDAANASYSGDTSAVSTALTDGQILYFSDLAGDKVGDVVTTVVSIGGVPMTFKVTSK